MWPVIEAMTYNLFVSVIVFHNKLEHLWLLLMSIDIEREIYVVMLSGEKCYVASSSSSSKNEKKLVNPRKKAAIDVASHRRNDI
jgi:hypothetical protein